MNSEKIIEKIAFIKRYAEQHTALFIAMVTFAITVLSFTINLSFCMYQIGYYGYFDIEKDVLISNMGNNSVLQISDTIAIGLITVFINIIGATMFLNKKFLKFLVLFFAFGVVLASAWIYLGNIITLSLKNVPIIIFLSVILSLIIGGATALPVICYAIIDYFDNKASRKRYEKLDAKQNIKNTKHRKPTDKTEEHSFSEEFFTSLSIVGIVIVLIIVVLPLWSGNRYAHNTRSMDIIKEPIYNSSFDELRDTELSAVIYQTNEFMIVSPCREENEELHILTDYQKKIDKSDILLQEQTYKNIIVEKN